MVSEFRKKKLMYVFNFFDTNKSGNIDKGDFELAVETITKGRGWTAGDAKYKEVQDIMMKIWNGIQSKADANKDGQVSADEWISMWDEFAKNPASPLEWQSQYCKFIFTLQDASNDGAIDKDEYSSVNVSFGMDKDESIKAFSKMAKGKANISWQEFQDLWKEYFTSEDPNAAGNYIFGSTNF